MTNTFWGVSAFYHDSAACLVHEGKIVTAAHFIARQSAYHFVTGQRRGAFHLYAFLGTL